MYFHKRMTGFYMHSVCLPENVTKHFSSLVGKFLKFKCPGGDTWQVELIKAGDKLVLEAGWNKFAGSNNVWQDDLLTFKLVSGSTFEVRIFDSLGWEICGSSGEEKEEEDEEEEEATNDVSIGKAHEFQVQEGSMSHASSRIKTATGKDCTSAKSALNLHAGKKRSSSHNQNSFPLQKRLKTSNCPSLCPEDEKVVRKEVPRSSQEKEEEFLEELEEARRNDLLATAHPNLLAGKKGLQEYGPSETKSPKENHSRDCGVPVDFVCGQFRWRTMTDEQKTRANSLAVEINAGNPAFLHVLQKSCLAKKPSIYIPKEFSAKYLPDQNQTILLRRPEKESIWLANYYFCPRRQRIESRSLFKFMQENNLQEGDICMFELDTSADQTTFTVHVSRAT
ncbi:hypothetical protein LUZ63_014312 [Rhynchospora breviuscula]|uniref:TF-B3 domain-containing protein n=1 Tax=Rhynchospora breviuscula TaxID=2022672 RepID=A0A9Q0CAD8_9POAL|nr:hypothetical protein LUZ63_014312 [Rhynchospora breviuscula]